MNRDNPSILIVDDEVDACLNLADIFTDLGYRVDIAHDGWSALELLQKRPYDVALLDLKMPGMDGLTLYRRIKKAQPGTMVLMITAFATSEIADQALAAGALQVLPKPVDFPILLGLVDQVLDRPLALIVDDDEDLCDNLWDLMHDRGYRVCLAHDEDDAAEQLNDCEYDIVLIDMKLPQSDGQRVFQLVKELNSEARTIAITGFRLETEQLVDQMVSDGMDAVCYKPFDISELFSTIERVGLKAPTLDSSGFRFAP